jgi:tetratricopeptide (TPR) repeat protein
VFACARSQETPAAPAALRPVALPDLSRVADSVQRQLRDRYAVLSQKFGNAVASADRAAAYGELGTLFLAAEYAIEAEACFLNAAALGPEDARWPYLLGYLYRKTGDLTKAATFFERSLQHNPGDVATLLRLGTVYLDQDRTDSAEPLFVTALSRDPQSAAALLGIGRAALARHDYSRAVDFMERALAQDPRASIVHYPLALAYRGLGDREKAEAHVRQRGDVEATFPDPLVEELDSVLDSAMAYQSRGIQALGRGNWREAQTYFRKGIAAGPDTASLRHRLGTALYLGGNTAAAVEEFEAALRLSPGYAQAHYSLGVILASTRRYPEAIERFATAVEEDPDYIEARLALGDTLRGVGRSADALRQYESILMIDPRRPDARFGSAIALVRLDRYREARDSLVESAALLPDHGEFALALARVLAASPDPAVRDGRRALRLAQDFAAGSRSVEVFETAAMAFAEVGDYAQAADWQRQAIDAAARAGDRDRAARMTDNLKLYDARRPCRTPWRRGELP